MLTPYKIGGQQRLVHYNRTFAYWVIAEKNPYQGYCLDTSGTFILGQIISAPTAEEVIEKGRRFADPEGPQLTDTELAALEVEGW